MTLWQSGWAPFVALGFGAFVFGYWFTPWWTDRTNKPKASE